jgi:hypothetical protein
VDALPAVPDLHHRVRRADLDALTDESVRRAVEALVEGDVVVDIDSSPGPFAGNEARRRQRLQRGLIDACEC